MLTNHGFKTIDSHLKSEIEGTSDPLKCSQDKKETFRINMRFALWKVRISFEI